MFLLNHANAYAGWYMPVDLHRKWLDDFKKYIDNGRELTNPTAVPGYPSPTFRSAFLKHRVIQCCCAML